MKAVQINQYGGVGALELNPDAPKPTPAKNQILVEVRAASLNPFDAKIRAGYLKDSAPLQFPATMGGDFSGVVQKLGPGVSAFKVGDELYGTANIFSGASGAFAEMATAGVENSALKPRSVSFEEAAAMVLVGSSAIQALEEHIKLQKGQKILIHGGAGGIGHIAIQIAKAIGTHIATTVSADDKDFVKSLGADEAIDYKNEKFAEKLKDFDAVYDPVGGQTTDRSFLVLKKGGVIVSMLGQPSEELAKKHEVTAIGQGTKINTTHLDRLRELVDGGKVKVQVDKVFPLEKVQAAFTHLETGHPRGKVVVKIK
jgi:alcohol dehydrogenase